MVTLQDKLNTMIDKLTNVDPLWVIFVKDHLSYIKSASVVVEVTNADRDRYRFKFEHFLRDKQCQPSVMWIARLINDLSMYEDFTTRDTIAIPSIADVTQLYRKYRTANNLI